MRSTLLTVITLGAAMLVAHLCSGTFGVAMAAKIDELKIKASELKGVFDEIEDL